MRYLLLIPITLVILSPLGGCSSEDREAITDKEAKRQTDRINDPMDKARKAADLLEKHNLQQLPD